MKHTHTHTYNVSTLTRFFVDWHMLYLWILRVARVLHNDGRAVHGSFGDRLNLVGNILYITLVDTVTHTYNSQVPFAKKGRVAGLLAHTASKGHDKRGLSARSW